MRWGRYKQFSFESAKERFLAKTEPHPSGCIIWKGAIGSHKRYGSFGLTGQSWLAHRAAWLLFKGEDPGKNCICHTCDNGFCVNPDHLFIGTQKDNVLDCETKGRAFHPSHEKHGRAKLTTEEVANIRWLHKQGTPIRAIARIYKNVNRTTIASIVHGRTWITT